jgi:hypothetical protein
MWSAALRQVVSVMSFSDSRKRVPVVEKAAWFVMGFAAVAVLHAVGGWWLNSGTGVLRTVLVLLPLGVFAALRRSGSPWVRACALWAGAISGTTVFLFSIGPGTIWPIVLAFGAAITAGAVFGGAFVGSAATRFRR